MSGHKFDEVRRWAIERILESGHHFPSVTDVINDAKAIAEFVATGEKPGERMSVEERLDEYDRRLGELGMEVDRAVARVTATREEMERRGKLDVEELAAALGKRITGTIKPEDMQASIDEARS